MIEKRNLINLTNKKINKQSANYNYIKMYPTTRFSQSGGTCYSHNKMTNDYLQIAVIKISDVIKTVPFETMTKTQKCLPAISIRHCLES